jgi:RNA-binding protein
MNLSPKQRRYLRARAHHLNPVVMTGSAGLSDAVLNEIDQAVTHHELIKIKLGGADRTQRQHMSTTICERLDAAAVQLIGQMLVIYRPAEKPHIALP